MFLFFFWGGGVLASINGELVVWGPVVWIFEIPKMKGIGILRGTSIRIPNHRVPNYPIYHELMAACLKRWCYFSFQDAFQFRARESKAAAGEDLMELEWSGDTDLYLKIHVFLLSSYFKMGKAIGFISPGNESISYPIHKYGKGR